MAKQSQQVPQKQNLLPVLRSDYEAVKQRVADLQIIDDGTRKIAAESIAILKKIIDRADALRDAEVRPLNDEVRAINARYKGEIITPASQILNMLNEKITADVRRQREEAAKVEQENQRILEEARKKQEAAEKKAEKKGVEAPPPPPVKLHDAPIVRKQTTTNYGSISVAENWVAEVTEIVALCQQIAEGKAPLQCVEANMVFLNKQAKAFKSAPCPYAGVRFYDKGKVGLR